MSNSRKIKLVQINMDQSDIQYVIELLTDAIRDQEWDVVSEARDFLKEYIDDDSSSIGLEE